MFGRWLGLVRHGPDLLRAATPCADPNFVTPGQRDAPPRQDSVVLSSRDADAQFRAVGARQRAGLRPVIPESSLTSDRLGEAVCRHDPPSARRRAASARTSYTPAGQARSPGEMPSPHALKPGLRTSHHNLSICSKPSDGRRRWSEHAVSGLDIGPKRAVSDSSDQAWETAHCLFVPSLSRQWSQKRLSRGRKCGPLASNRVAAALRATCQTR